MDDLVKRLRLAPSQFGQYLSGTQQASSALQNVGAATPDLINTLGLHPETFDASRSLDEAVSQANAEAMQRGARDALNPYTMDKSSSGSNTVNIGGLDPLQGYDVGVWIKDVGYRGNTGRSVLVGQFSSIVIAIKNVSDPYMAVGYRQPLYLDGEVQISFTLEKGLLDIDIFTETFGFAQFDREFRFNRTPRFEITFALDPVDWHALYKPGYQFGEKLERKPVGRFVLGRCKFETLNIGATSGKNVVATQWNGIAHSIRAHRDGSTPSSREDAEKNSSALNVPHLKPDVEGARSGYLDPGKVALTDHSKDYQPESTATSGWFGEGKETLASLLTTLNSLKSTNVFGVSVSSLGLGAVLDSTIKVIQDRIAAFDPVRSTAAEGTTKSTQASSTDSKDGVELGNTSLLKKRQDLLAQLIAAAGNPAEQAEVKAKLAEVEKKLDERDSGLSKRSEDGFEQGVPTNLTKLPEQTNSTAAEGTTKSTQTSSTDSKGGNENFGITDIPAINLLRKRQDLLAQLIAAAGNSTKQAEVKAKLAEVEKKLDERDSELSKKSKDGFEQGVPASLTRLTNQSKSTDSRGQYEDFGSQDFQVVQLLRQRQDLLAQLIAAAGNPTEQTRVRAELDRVEKKLDERDSELSKKSTAGEGTTESTQTSSTDSKDGDENFGITDSPAINLLRERQDLLAQLIAAAGNPAEQTRVRAELDRVEKKLDERDSELSKKSTAAEGTTKSTQTSSTDSKDGDELGNTSLLKERQDLLAQLIAAAGNSTKQAEVKAKLAEVEKKLDERDSELSKRSKDGFEKGAPTNLTKLPEQTNSTAAQGTTKSNQKSSTASEGTKLLLTPEQSSAVDTLKSALSAKLNQLQVQLSQTTDKQQKQKLNQQIKEITAAIAATDTLQSVAYDLSVGGTQQPNTAGQGTTQINSAAPSVAGPGVKKVNPDTLSTDESEKKDAKFTAGPKQNPSTGGPGTTKVNPDTLSSD